MPNRRTFIKSLFGASSMMAACTSPHAQTEKQGEQRLSLAHLQKWQELQYGMFIHFGMSTFLGQELPDGQSPSTVYAPDQLDVDQWITVARDAGMKYAVLTTKHVAGHCLWPTEHNQYNVTNSGNTTDVVEKFVRACEKYRVNPGFYYCSWDNHNRFGSRTPSEGRDWNAMNSFPKSQQEPFPAFTTSLYHHFQTAQIEELLQNYGPIMEMWIDIPGVLGKGYRDYLYHHVGDLQNDIVIMMNSGFGDGTNYNVDYAWPSDLVAIERDRPPKPAHDPWRTIHDKNIYLPAEHCDPIGKEWFWVDGDKPRPDVELAEQFEQCRERKVNFLLDVPPNRHGLIPQYYVDALQRLRKNVNL